MKRALIFILAVIVITFGMVSCNNNIKEKKPSTLNSSPKTDTHSAESGMSGGATITHIESRNKNQSVNVAFPSPIAGKPQTSLIFDQTSVDFGTIRQNTTHTHIFRLKNTGKNPLIIAKAKPSCGCTIASYPKHPIAPGKIVDLKVEYNSEFQKGKIHKTVAVVANTEPPTTVLTLTANVLTKK